MSSVDLPSLSTKPLYISLHQILTSLEIQPSTWTSSSPISEEDPNLTKEINAWLPTIFRSSLKWFEDTTSSSADEQREMILDMASKRMAERCGRSAQGNMTRTWLVPSHLIPNSTTDLSISLHEPALTEGNTGHKTWGTAYALIKQLSSLSSESGGFKHLFSSDLPRPYVLELGSGTGLLGIAAAAIWSCPVVLTDLPSVMPNLRRNIGANLPSIASLSGSLIAETLDWAEHPVSFASESIPSTYPIILASDPIYDTEQIPLLASTLHKYLSPSPSLSARALVAVPLRDAFSANLASQLEILMKEHGFVVLDRSLIEARDDFGSGKGEVTIRRDVYGRMDEALGRGMDGNGDGEVR